MLENHYIQKNGTVENFGGTEELQKYMTIKKSGTSEKNREYRKSMYFITSKRDEH